MASRYGVKKGQIYLAADGGKYGHIVIDDSTYIDVDDVVVIPFDTTGNFGEPRRIDTFKLAYVRYSLVGEVRENSNPH
ncbi:hypothetical protein D3C87_278540 [compost metagenome]